MSKLQNLFVPKMGESFYIMCYDFLCNSDMLCYAGIHNTRRFLEVLYFDRIFSPFSVGIFCRYFS